MRHRVIHRATTATKPLIGRLPIEVQIVHLFTVASETGSDEPLCPSTCFRCLPLILEDTEDLFMEFFPVAKEKASFLSEQRGVA